MKQSRAIFIFLIGSMRAILRTMEANTYIMELDIKGIVNLWTKDLHGLHRQKYRQTYFTDSYLYFDLHFLGGF